MLYFFGVLTKNTSLKPVFDVCALLGDLRDHLLVVFVCFGPLLEELGQLFRAEKLAQGARAVNFVNE